MLGRGMNTQGACSAFSNMQAKDYIATRKYSTWIASSLMLMEPS